MWAPGGEVQDVRVGSPVGCCFIGLTSFEEAPESTVAPPHWGGAGSLGWDYHRKMARALQGGQGTIVAHSDDKLCIRLLLDLKHVATKQHKLHQFNFFVYIWLTIIKLIGQPELLLYKVCLKYIQNEYSFIRQTDKCLALQRQTWCNKEGMSAEMKVTAAQLPLKERASLPSLWFIN